MERVNSGISLINNLIFSLIFLWMSFKLWLVIKVICNLMEMRILQFNFKYILKSKVQLHCLTRPPPAVYIYPCLQTSMLCWPVRVLVLVIQYFAFIEVLCHLHSNIQQTKEKFKLELMDRSPKWLFCL